MRDAGRGRRRGAPYRQGRFGEIGDLGPLSIREIGLLLVSYSLVAAEESYATTPDCPAGACATCYRAGC